MRIYEINTRAHCQRFNQISDAELKEAAELGFDAIWLMGVWQISEGARRLSKIVAEDFEGSPYAVPVYNINPDLGGQPEFQSMVERAHAAGLSVIVDFVSNHMAIDSPWVAETPEFFIRSDPKIREQSTGDFFLHPSGEVVAFGRDPYFPAWTDTAQLDYTCAGLRSRMIETLKQISRLADGVRCDMAMLVMRDYIRRQWYPHAPPGWFDKKMPAEFWEQAIREVKADRPDFTFIAEAYWDTEPQLVSFGFDLTYEKRVLDALVARNHWQVVERLMRPIDAIRASLYFIENHDEPRAASIFNQAGNLLGAALTLSLPGSVLIHEGQMVGRGERLPVQRIKPLTEESDDLSLKAAYTRLLKITADDVFRSGSFQLFDSGAYGVVAFTRQNEKRVVAYLGQVADAWHTFSDVLLDISPMARAIGAGHRLRVINLLDSQSIMIEQTGGAFRIHLNQISVERDARFCLIEAMAG